MTPTPTTQQRDADIRELLDTEQSRDAFELLVERYAQRIFHLALGMLGNETHAQDITQDVLLKVWKGLGGYSGLASLSTWIYTIARNTCLTELKKRSNRTTISLHEPNFEAGLDAEPAFQSRDPDAGAGLDVGALLEQIPDKYRQVLTLFYLEQKSYEEVAALLGLPLGTVKTFLYRAKRELVRLNRREPALAQLV